MGGAILGNVWLGVRRINPW